MCQDWERASHNIKGGKAEIHAPHDAIFQPFAVLLGTWCQLPILWRSRSVVLAESSYVLRA